MKRLLALLLALLMLVSMTACVEINVGGNEKKDSDEEETNIVEETEDVTEEEPEVIEEEIEVVEKDEIVEEEPEEREEDLKELNQTAELSLGEVDGYVYENTYFGIGCELDSSWTYMGKEELAEYVGLIVDGLDLNELSKAIVNNDYYMDMIATSSYGASINVGVEKPMLDLTTEQYCKMSLTSTRQTLEAAGYTVNNLEATTVEVDGQMMDALTVEGELYGIELYQIAFLVKKGEHVVMATVTATSQESAEELLDAFYLF